MKRARTPAADLPRRCLSRMCYEPEMDRLASARPGGRCRSGAWLWFVRPGNVDERGGFECRRCRVQYRAQEDGWTPGTTSELPGLGDQEGSGR